MSDGLITWLRWAFNIYDKDGSGDIELSEMVDIFVLIYTMQVSWWPPTLHEKLFTLNPKQLHGVVFSSWYLFTIIIREVLKKMLRFRQKRWVWLKLCSNSIDSTQIIFLRCYQFQKFFYQNVLQVFSALDKDNDGGIGVDEFVTVCFRIFFC